MPDITIFHNPRCSKSRQTLELLISKDATPEIIEYLETPPSEQQIEEILGLLGLEPRELMRTHEPEYKNNHLDDPALSREALIQAMHYHPKIIERPIVITGGRAVIGRPPERVLEIINND